MGLRFLKTESHGDILHQILLKNCMFSRARAGRGHMATRWVGGPFFVYCCKTGESNTAICSGSSEVVLCSRQQALERCKSKYSVVCSSSNTAVWPAGRRFGREGALVG